MINSFTVDSTFPNSHIELSNYLLNQLTEPILEKRPIIFLCIGTDRSTGDSLGPLVGYKIKRIISNNIYTYGSLEYPIHAQNIVNILDKINTYFKKPYIIAIDACLGNVQNIGKIFISKSPIHPGLCLNKNLPPVGDLSITGIVNISGNLEYTILQNTRLYTVMTLADCISDGIKKVIESNPYSSIEKTK